MSTRSAFLAAALCVLLAIAPVTLGAGGRGTELAASSPPAGHASEWHDPAQDPPTISRSDLINPAHTIVDLRWLGGVGALVLAAVFLLLWAYRRRPYILEWAGSWALLAAGLMIASYGSGLRFVEDVAVGVSQFLFICSGLLFVISVDTFQQRSRLSRRHLIVLLPVLIWFTLAPLALGAWAVQVPGFLIAAGATATAGIGYLVLLRRTRLLGAGLVGLMFVCVACAHLWVSLSEMAGGFSVELFSTTAILYVFAAFGMHLLVFEDMTYELRRANRRLESAQGELRHLVITDALTGCYNRRFFDEVIGREVERHRRYEIPLSLVFVDVDRFKAINDALGHETGDQVLQHVAGFLTRHIREADYVFRWGGDEFLILISCGVEEALRKSIRLQEQFA
jgi:GGDEF domain-containing protein